MTPEQRAAYKAELLKVGFDETQATQIVDEAAARADSVRILRGTEGIPLRQEPIDKRERAVRVVTERTLLDGPRRPTQSTIRLARAPRGSALEKLQADFERGLRELDRFSDEEIAYIVGSDG
jgi:hypothetical protein